jgi:alkanesulfonate monooxygenase SsuD/methylene tetrahydromethanopterin reductase-like flavin-dependent oxidoreductase (luciferase family)
MLIGFKTSPNNVDWQTLDETWAAAGEIDAFDSAWMNDHLSDPSMERHGGAFESMTLMAALAHRVRGKWLGHLVLSNTFRHPAVLAKQATVMDHVTGGRFILGLGAGWHQGEHDAFGVPLPPMKERFDRFESAVRSIKALGTEEARRPPGVDLDVPFSPLRQATNEPPPLTPGGPPVWLGGQKPRGLRIAAQYADGWNYPGTTERSVEEFIARRDRLFRSAEEVGRDPGELTICVQIRAGETAAQRREAVEEGKRYAAAGCEHLVLVMLAKLGPSGLQKVAREVAEPIRDRR